MENHTKSGKIHPLVAGAAVSVMLVSLVGVAAITGLLPSSNSSTAPVAPVAASAPMPAADNKVATLAPTTEAKQFANGKEPDAPAVRNEPKQKPEYKPEYKPAAKTEYKPPLHASAQNTTPTYNENTYTPAVQAAICNNCGTIESIQAVQQAAPQNGIGIGAVAGAVLGGVLGNQVGGGNGRKLATIAGAVGGGFAGNEVERRTRTTSYEIRVRMEDGSVRSISDSGQSGWTSGDRVRVVNGSLTSQE